MKNGQKELGEKIESAIRILLKNLHESWLYFCIWSELSYRWHTDSSLLMYYDRFFGGVMDACLRTAILLLAELLSKGKSSVNVWYLINLAESSPTYFRYVQDTELLKAIKGHREWMEDPQQQQFTHNLFVKRDKILAHTDRKFVVDERSSFLLENPPLDEKQVREVFHTLYQMLSLYETYFYGSPGKIGFRDVEPGVKDEITRLVKCLEITCRTPRHRSGIDAH